MVQIIDYPVCLRLDGRPVLLVGGGAIAEGRARQLVEAGAALTVVAPRVTDELRALLEARRLPLAERRFIAGDLSGQSLVFVTIDDPQESRAIVEAARAKGLWVNAADLPEQCDFTLPSVGRRGPLVVAVSSSGAAPALAARLRRRLTAQIGREEVWLARLSGWLRRKLPRGAERMKRLKDLAADATALAGERRKHSLAALRAELLEGETR